MSYLAITILLAAASLVLDIAGAMGKAVEAMRSGGTASGTTLLPGLVFLPVVGCGLSWLINRAFPGYGPWIIGFLAVGAILFGFGYYFRCRHLLLLNGYRWPARD
ncbi:hypothetical protein IV454_00695 [Massilia antarctica]|uniref:Uncharacterized protein n=1 Tax=Massilia antarctica TaxID=2765360 RepID=A0AA49A8B7_9BURK|nr:hypothetical protein [Massilia antarctica]QPI50194.1 hypothetical protein IV454_00695 [Massilia antarctica]